MLALRRSHAYPPMLSPGGALTDAMKAQIAEAITVAHVEATGAPRAFVRVFFNELPPGSPYSGGELDTTLAWITERSVRDGPSTSNRN